MTGQVIVDITMSLDGHVTAPGAGIEHGLGIDGEPLHEWVFAGTAEDDAIRDEMTAHRRGHHGPPVVRRHRRPARLERLNRLRRRPQRAATGVRAYPSTAAHLAARRTVQLRHRGTAPRTRAGPRGSGREGRRGHGRRRRLSRVPRCGLGRHSQYSPRPIVLGGGTRLFPAQDAPRLRLQQVGIVTTPAVHHLSYRVTD